MDLNRKINFLQRYYAHPFKEISPNAILITDASEITYNVANDIAHSSMGECLPRERYVEIGFNSYELIKDKKAFNILNTKMIDIVLFLEKNELIENDTYILFQKCSLYTAYRSSMYNTVYDNDGNSKQLLRYDDNKKQYISGRAKEVIITQVNS